MLVIVCVYIYIYIYVCWYISIRGSVGASLYACNYMFSLEFRLHIESHLCISMMGHLLSSHLPLYTPTLVFAHSLAPPPPPSCTHLLTHSLNLSLPHLHSLNLSISFTLSPSHSLTLFQNKNENLGGIAAIEMLIEPEGGVQLSDVSLNMFGRYLLNALVASDTDVITAAADAIGGQGV